VSLAKRHLSLLTEHVLTSHPDLCHSPLAHRLIPSPLRDFALLVSAVAALACIGIPHVANAVTSLEGLSYEVVRKFTA
jgi:hypothetical protein